MTTATLAVDNAAKIVEVVEETIRAHLPKMVEATHDTDKPSTLSITIKIKPNAKVTRGVNVELTPRVTLPGGGGSWIGHTERIDNELQLVLGRLFE